MDVITNFYLEYVSLCMQPGSVSYPTCRSIQSHTQLQSYSNRRLQWMKSQSALSVTQRLLLN